MERNKLILLLLLSALWCQMGFTQQLNAEQAIVKRLRGESVDGLFRWNPDDKALKKMSLDIIRNDTVLLTNKGLLSLISHMTSSEYDRYYDSLFLDVLFERDVRIDSFFNNLWFIPTHFLKSDYNQKSLDKLTFFTSTESLLYWKPWIADYLTFLQVDSIGSALIYLKNNLDCIRTLNPNFNSVFRPFDTLDVNINLARLGLVNDTLVVDEVIRKYTAPKIRYKTLIKKLAKIRTQYAFTKIGAILLKDDFLSHDKKLINHYALAAFINYVDNFPDHATKRQIILGRGSIIIKYSKKHGKDYSTDEYLKMARDWYRMNRDNLVLNYDKY